MRIVSVCLLIIFVSFLYLFPPRVGAHFETGLPSASQGQIDEALEKTVPVRFLPSSPLYILIQTKEIVSRFFQPSSSKRAEFDFVLSGKRLKEIYLMTKNGDIKDASSNFARYDKTLDRMIDQIEKARSQNQEVTPLIDRIVEGLQAHETLLYAIYGDFKEGEDQFNFDENFKIALEAHGRTVLAIDRIKPGIKTRFNTVTQNEATGEPDLKTNETNILFESTPAVKPRRIIY